MRTCWEALRKSLVRTLSTLMAHQQFNAARRTRRELQRFHDAVALLDYLHRSKDGDRDEKNRILANLVEMAQSSGDSRMLGTNLLWLALWPGLDAVYRRRLSSFAGAPEELVSEIGDHFTATIHSADLKRIHRIAATLVCNVERDIREGLLRRWAKEASHISLPEEDRADEDDGSIPYKEPATRSISEFGLPLGLRADEESVAIRRILVEQVGVDGNIVVDVAILGESQREVGERLGLHYETARKRYQRALTSVREWFMEPLSHSPPPCRVCHGDRASRPKGADRWSVKRMQARSLPRSRTNSSACRDSSGAGKSSTSSTPVPSSALRRRGPPPTASPCSPCTGANSTSQRHEPGADAHVGAATP